MTPEVNCLSMYLSSVPAFSKHFFSPMGENDKLPGSSQGKAGFQE